MQRAVRIVDNQALDIAIEAGNLLGLPVVAYFQVIPNYPNANLRHYHFLHQGLRDVAQDAAERGVGFVVRKHPDNSIEAFLEEAGAALLVGDENPCREPERWRSVLAKRLKLPYGPSMPTWLCRRASSPQFCAAAPFRPHLKRELPKYLVAAKKIEPAHAWKPPKALRVSISPATSARASRSSTALSDRSTALPVARMRRSKARDFVNLELKDYETSETS